MNNLTLKDCAYKIFEHDRGGPEYFALKKRELFAMIRQLGPPTIFLTLSSAETKWLELLVNLKKTVDNETITESEAEELTSHHRRRLSSSDPVTSARYFRYKLKCIFKLFKESKHCLFGKHYVKEYYIRTEFQFRGGPHAHIILWLNNSPIYKENDDKSRKKCEEFIDQFITCEKIEESEFAKISYQIHHHSKTCKRRRNGRSYCRFNIPWFPMDKTTILEPLQSDEYDDSEIYEIECNYENVRMKLAELYKAPPDITFNEFLNALGLNKSQYYTLICYSISRPTVFLKREVNAIKINAYNKNILDLFGSNMDIQFIVYVYSCAQYVINYISKSRGELSKTLENIRKQLHKGDGTLCEKLYHLSNTFLNTSEFSAQECVYYILGFPICECSRQVTFINTSLPENRI